MRALPVTNDNGTFTMGNAKITSWTAASDGAERIEDLGPLVGWGRWTHAYRLRFPKGLHVTYFTEAAVDG